MRCPDTQADSEGGVVLKVIDFGCSTFCVPGKRLCKKFGTVGGDPMSSEYL